MIIFFNSNSQIFISEQLTEIKKVRLSRVLCDNGDNIVTIQPFALELPSQYKYYNCYILEKFVFIILI